MKLLKTPSPTGDAKIAVDKVKAELEKYCEVNYTRKGALLAKIER